MEQLVFITTAWGPKHGGVNAFNTDLAKAARVLLGPGTVLCVVLDATEEEVREAENAGVKLLALGIKGADRVDETHAPGLLDAVRAHVKDVRWWIGHDVISGPAAVALRANGQGRARQGKSAVIHHMSYIDYSAVTHGDASVAKAKKDLQQKIFQRADRLIAVGPLLRDSLRELVQGKKEVAMLVPGLADIRPLAEPPKAFSAMTFGRFDPKNEPLKQVRLAVAGFANACRTANESLIGPEALRYRPRLYLYGVSEGADEYRQWQTYASEKAARLLNVLPLPYEHNRLKLFDELKQSSVAMMLSWHEGFGLVGWEAISAGIPLIVSRRMGLYQLIEEELGASGIGCLKVVEIRGALGHSADAGESFLPEDLTEVTNAILEVAARPDSWRRNAQKLRDQLLEKRYTWDNAAMAFAQALGLNRPEGRPAATANDPPPALTAELRTYLGTLRGSVERLALDAIDRTQASDSQSSSDLALDAVYTALLTRSTEQEDPSEQEEPGKQYSLKLPGGPARHLSALEQANRFDRLVLLGDPGSGKSTFVNFVALCMTAELLDKNGIAQLTAPLPEGEEDEDSAQPWDHGALLPVRVVLRDFAARGFRTLAERGTAEHLASFIEDLPESRDSGCWGALRDRLMAHGGLVLLDGLDEVPEAGERREQIKQAVEDFAARYPRCRMLVTSRTYAYRQQNWRLAGFEEAELAPFTPVQVDTFIDRWYESIAKARGQHRDDAQRRAENLKQAISRNDRLMSLAERPLLLTLMASLHAWRGGELPERRADLYQEAVELLLERWQQQSVVSSGKESQRHQSMVEFLKVDRQGIRDLLGALAFRAHRSQPEVVGTADIQEKDLVEGLLELSPDRQLMPRLIVDFLRDRAGILIPRGHGVHAFVHRTFQEYLAACHLVEGEPFPETIIELFRAEPERWREVLLLAAAKETTGLWLLVEKLCEDEPGGHEVEPSRVWSAHAAGLALAETANLKNLAPKRRQLVERVRRWQLDIMEGIALPAGERVLAGLALDRLGDPRFKNNPWSLPGDEWLGFVKIPAGRFRMGSDRQQDSIAFHGEEPQHEVTLPEYYIGRYPVTVGQFQAYCRARGVTPEAPGILRGAPNLPMGAVTWGQAMEYCKWLTEELGASERAPEPLRRLLRGEGGRRWQVTLPSEAEWEKAARGEDGRIYPWGNEWGPDRANCKETGVGDRSPVGCFGEGKGPYGVEEMIGNVWEWTRSKWGKYPYPQEKEGQAERETLDGEEARVVRGGAFNSTSWFARCAYRNRYLPAFRDILIGFRVVVSPFNSEL